MRAFTAQDSLPYDGDQPLRQCITTNGGMSNKHPNGGRSFNLQELACLAGFPPSHRFFGNVTSIKKQIGNAVPACFAKALYQEIVKTLKESDDEEVGWEADAVVID